MRPKPIAPGPGQESVWDYPRPPRLEPSTKTVRLVFAGQELALTRAAYRALETSHPPTWYIPREDVRMDLLRASDKQSLCEFKGRAAYFDLVHQDKVAPGAVWTYPSPTGRFEAIANYLCFYATALDACTIDAEQVLPQPGGFYGGWITSDVVGPFKGIPGSWGW